MFILKGLQNDFLQVFIVKGLGGFAGEARSRWNAARREESVVQATEECYYKSYGMSREIVSAFESEDWGEKWARPASVFAVGVVGLRSTFRIGPRHKTCRSKALGPRRVNAMLNRTRVPNVSSSQTASGTFVA